MKLVHIDGSLPNLALMNLSTWHKDQGDSVYFSRSPYRDLFEPEFDKVYGSSIFTRSENAREKLSEEFPQALIAGTGSGNNITLEEITGQDKFIPDYSIYPKFEQSIGFSQRGCRLKCKFCVVPKKEGKIKDNSSIYDIWRGGEHKKEIVLLDNDFFGQPDWKEKCREIKEGGFKVNFNQGINVRLISEEAARELALLKYYDVNFKRRSIYTAYDNPRDEKIFLRGFKILTDAGIPPSHIVVYMLVGFWEGESINDVINRFNQITELGAFAYPMVFDEKNKQLKKFQRWAIRRYFTFIKWEDFN